MTILLATVLLILPVSKRIGLPIVAGYIIVGIILSGLIYLFDYKLTLTYSLMEFSVIALMFFLGLHLRPSILPTIPLKIAKLHLLTILVLGFTFTAVIWAFSNISVGVSILLGFAFAFSGLSLLLPTLQNPRKKNILLKDFQYHFLTLNLVFFALLLILVPIFAGLNSPQHGIAYVAAIIATCSGLFWFGQTQFKRCFHFLARYQSTELIIVFVITLCTAILSLMQAMQMPLALGALICGIILADAPFRAELNHHLEIWKPLLIGLFFTTIALQLSFDVLTENLSSIVIITAIIILAKALTWFGLLVRQKKNRIDAFLSGLSIAHSAECTLLIILLALTEQLINTQQAQILSWVVISSIILNAFLQWASQHILERKNKTNLEKENSNLETNTHNEDKDIAQDTGIIIAGFGRFGQMIGRVAHLQQLPFIAIDNSIDELKFLSNYGGKFIAADISDPEYLQKLPLNSAKMFILAVDDVDDAMTIARYLHLYHPQLPVLARARDRHHAYLLQELGVHYIWRETWHSALDLAKHILLLNHHSDATAEKWLQIFKQYDEGLLTSQQGIYTNPHYVTQYPQNTIQELENLFENDLFVQQQQHFLQNDKSANAVQSNTTSP